MSEYAIGYLAAQATAIVLLVYISVWAIVRSIKRSGNTSGSSNWVTLVVPCLAIILGVPGLVTTIGQRMRPVQPRVVSHEPEWTQYSPPDDTFYVSFPGKAKADIEKRPIKSGTAKTYRLKYVGVEHRPSYIAQCTSYSGCRVATSMESLVKLQDALIRKEDGILINSRTIIDNDYPGLDCVFYQKPEGKIHVQYYVFENRLYYLWAGGINNNLSEKESAQFFKSFSVLTKDVREQLKKFEHKDR